MIADATAELDVAALRREEFPWTDEAIYLNSASIGPLPERTRLALEAFNRKRAAPYLLGDHEFFEVFDVSRARVAQLLNASPAEIALAFNTSYGLNLAARGLPLETGDVIVASDREFPANVYPWLRLQDKGVRLELAPVTADGWPDEAHLLERMGDAAVRVVAVSLVQFSNGYKVDLARLSARARETDTFLVVDAIQGLGAVQLDVQATPVDILSCGAQKWLLGPWGSGFTYVRRELIPKIDPVVTGWMAFEGTDDFTQLTTYRPTLRADARRFEMITLPFQDFAGMNASLELLLELGIGRIEAYLRTLHAPVRDWAARRGYPIASPEGIHASQILGVVLPDPGAAFRRLQEAGVVASLREGAIRLSPHVFNTIDEMVKVTEILDRP
jgi:cysteine desulfurase / selenocysteine lyase